MPKTIADEHVALKVFTAPPMNPAAMTVSEWNAGTDLQCRIMDYRLSPTDSDTIQQSELCNATNANVPTRRNYEGNVTVFRYLTTQGLADALNDIAWDTFSTFGSTLYLADREGPEHDATGAVGQEYSYFEVITDAAKKPTDRGGFIRREITLHVQRAWTDLKLVNGGSS